MICIVLLARLQPSATRRPAIPNLQYMVYWRQMTSACASPGIGLASTELVDFVFVWLGYPISGERTLP